jgi:hypothetical protein
MVCQVVRRAAAAIQTRRVLSGRDRGEGLSPCRQRAGGAGSRQATHRIIKRLASGPGFAAAALKRGAGSPRWSRRRAAWPRRSASLVPQARAGRHAPQLACAWKAGRTCGSGESPGSPGALVRARAPALAPLVLGAGGAAWGTGAARGCGAGAGAGSTAGAGAGAVAGAARARGGKIGLRAGSGAPRARVKWVGASGTNRAVVWRT